METLLIVWRFVLLGSILIFPQLLGILVYCRLSRVPRWLSAIVAALLSAIVFFSLVPNFFFAGIRESFARGEGRGCGMPAIAAAFLFLAGTVGQLLAGVFAQIILSRRRRRSC